MIRRVRTGRQNIYVLGEWIDVHHDSSYRLEWFYLEGRYGISKSDLTESIRSDLTPSSSQARLPPSDQTRRRASDNNRDGNIERKSVNGAQGELHDKFRQDFEVVHGAVLRTTYGSNRW